MKLIEKIKQKAFSKYLLWKTRPCRIKKYLDKKEIPDTNRREPPDSGNVKIASAQVRLKMVSEPLEYVETMFRLVKRAYYEGAQIIVFPEYNFLQLLGMLPGIDKIAPKDKTAEKFGGIDLDGLDILDVFRFLTPVMKVIFATTYSELARRFGIYIITGSVLLSEKDGSVYSVAMLYDDKGRLVGQQKKLHLMPVEAEMGINCGQEIRVFDTRLGKIAFPICMDATYFETFRMLELMGADIVFLPIADNDYNEWKALRGIWPRVQESSIYGVKSALVGEILGMDFAGKSGIYAPMELTKNKDGIVVEAESADKEELVIGEVCLNKLHEFRRQKHIIGDRNLELYERYFPKLYENLYKEQ